MEPDRSLDWSAENPREWRSRAVRPRRPIGPQIAALACGFFLAGMLWLLPFLAMQQFDLDRGIIGTWPIPSDQTLNQASGVLELPSLISPSRGASWWIGNLLTDDGKLLSFSCDPGGRLACVYARGPYARSPLNGRHVTVRYFYMSKWIYPDYHVTLPGQASRVTVARKPAAIIMELTPSGSAAPSLTYRESLARLERYMATHQPLRIPWLSNLFARSRNQTAMSIDPRTQVATTPSGQPYRLRLGIAGKVLAGLFATFGLWMLGMSVLIVRRLKKVDGQSLRWPLVRFVIMLGIMLVALSGLVLVLWRNS